MTTVSSKYSEEQIATFRRRFAEVACAQLADSAAEFTNPLPLPLVARNGLPRVCGPVFPVTTSDDMLPCLQGLAAAPPGWVLFIHNEISPSEGLAGDIFVASAEVQRLGGIVVNGAVRDLEAIADIPVPVFSTEVNFVSARTTSVLAEAVPDTVDVAGCRLAPGDWIFGDEDGFLMLPESHVSAVLASGAVLREREDRLRRTMREQGRTLAELTGLDEFIAGSGPLKFNP
ncbi:RraA family protein [Streptomyces sp. NPDC047042]|uniref:RraA family protein n=1 Tax=Streptomyces sp. NPDC047042 TaxID=3154807 RepID=UPI0033D12632